MNNISWFSNAACRGKTYYFFPHFAERPEAKDKREVRARKICAECPVISQCREYARANGEHGFWGGESEDERFSLGYIYDPMLLRRQRAKERRRSGREEHENVSVIADRPSSKKTITQ